MYVVSEGEGSEYDRWLGYNQGRMSPTCFPCCDIRRTDEGAVSKNRGNRKVDYK